MQGLSTFENTCKFGHRIFKQEVVAGASKLAHPSPDGLSGLPAGVRLFFLVLRRNFIETYVYADNARFHYSSPVDSPPRAPPIAGTQGSSSIFIISSYHRHYFSSERSFSQHSTNS